MMRIVNLFPTADVTGKLGGCDRPNTVVSTVYLPGFAEKIWVEYGEDANVGLVIGALVMMCPCGKDPDRN